MANCTGPSGLTVHWPSKLTIHWPSRLTVHRPGFTVHWPSRFTVHWPGLIVHWPGLIVRWPGLIVRWPGLIVRWPGLIVHWPSGGGERGSWLVDTVDPFNALMSDTASYPVGTPSWLTLSSHSTCHKDRNNKTMSDTASYPVGPRFQTRTVGLPDKDVGTLLAPFPDPYPVNTKHFYNIYTVLDQHRRCWTDVLYKCFNLYSAGPTSKTLDRRCINVLEMLCFVFTGILCSTSTLQR